MSKGEPAAANQSFTSHILPFAGAGFTKSRAEAQKGESTYLIRAAFDELFRFAQALILMWHADSVHLAPPPFNITGITASERLFLHTRQRNGIFLDETVEPQPEQPFLFSSFFLSIPLTGGRRGGGGGGSKGGSVYHDFSKVQSTQYDVN